MRPVLPPARPLGLLLQVVKHLARFGDEENAFILAVGLVLGIDAARVAVAEVDLLADAFRDFPEWRWIPNLLRTMHPDLPVGHQDKTTRPRRHVFILKHLQHSSRQSLSARKVQPKQKQANMSARRKLANVGEVQILGDEETTAHLGRLPHVRIGTPGQPFFAHVVGVVAECAN